MTNFDFYQVIPNYSSRELYDKMFALGVTMYGQMTAGSYCYIGPQGIVHGTTVSSLAELISFKFWLNKLRSFFMFTCADCCFECWQKTARG